MQRAAIVAAVLVAWLVGLEGQGQPAGTLLVRNGRVIDGTGAPPRQVDVRVSLDTIVEIGPHLMAGPGEQVLDAAGRVVAPGFVDVHSHADGGLVDHPDATSQVQQGITTALVGQDGGGDLPVSDFLERMEAARPAINIATSVGHGTVRGLVLGAEFKRASTDSEIAVMRALVERGMKDGAVGLSSGLEYDPGFYAQPAEIAALASAIRPFGGLYSSHVRDEENEVVAAWREAIEVGRRAGVAVEISHGTSMEEADMRAIFAHPRVVICSDGQLSGRHPRGYNAFPRVLARYVRETPLVTLEEAIAKMTGRSAARLGLTDRGIIAIGRKADLVVFDAGAVADRGTPQQPALSPIGIDAVVVNGTLVLSNGTPTGARPGHALRPNRSQASARAWRIGPRHTGSGA